MLLQVGQFGFFFISAVSIVISSPSMNSILPTNGFPIPVRHLMTSMTWSEAKAEGVPPKIGFVLVSDGSFGKMHLKHGPFPGITVVICP